MRFVTACLFLSLYQLAFATPITSESVTTFDKSQTSADSADLLTAPQTPDQNTYKVALPKFDLILEVQADTSKPIAYAQYNDLFKLAAQSILADIRAGKKRLDRIVGPRWLFQHPTYGIETLFEIQDPLRSSSDRLHWDEVLAVLLDGLDPLFKKWASTGARVGAVQFWLYPSNAYGKTSPARIASGIVEQGARGSFLRPRPTPSTETGIAEVS